MNEKSKKGGQVESRRNKKSAKGDEKRQREGEDQAKKSRRERASLLLLIQSLSGIVLAIFPRDRGKRYATCTTTLNSYINLATTQTVLEVKVARRTLLVVPG